MTPATAAAVGAAIEAATGCPFAVKSVRSVSGGSIHAAFEVDDGSARYFVKLNAPSAAPMFAAEADGLRALAAAEAIRTPAVVASGASADDTFLVLEHIDLRTLDATAGRRLGAALAQLHRTQGDRYGWHGDNFIGATPQLNEVHHDWPWFFGARRLRPQLERARGNGMDRALVAQGEAIAERVGALFLEYRPAPSLLHGDLWSGNAACDGSGAPVIFDPAAYYGDREADLAMAELFGGFPLSFYAAYRAAWPLDPGYERRKPLYNLYHVLNHFNLFGGAYLGQARRMIEGLNTALRR